MISKSSINEVNTRLDAVAVVGDYVRLENRGGRWWGLCPFHSEKTASFTVDAEKKLYYCFSCHEGGNIVKFVMAMDKLSFPEAVELLAKRSGVDLVYDNANPGDAGEAALAQALKAKEQSAELYERIAGTYHHLLLNNNEGKSALDYILNRKISKEMIEKFRLGYSPRDRCWLYNFLKGKFYSAEFLSKSGLFSRKYPESSFFSGRLMFPINNKDGKTVAFGARLLSGEGPKYINSGESPLYSKRETLFGIDFARSEIRQTKAVYLCEGYMDVIAMHQAGITNSVAPLGTAFTPEQAKLLARWAVRINLIFDSDSAGEGATVKAIYTARAAGLETYVVQKTSADSAMLQAEKANLKDPADILQHLGPDHLIIFAKSVILDFDFLLNLAIKKFDLRNPKGKSNAAHFLFPFLETEGSALGRESYFRALADKLGVEQGNILFDFEDWQRKSGKRIVDNNDSAGNNPGNEQIVLSGELHLLTVAFVNFSTNRTLFLKIRENFEAGDFVDSNARELYFAAEEAFRSGETEQDAILNFIKKKELRDFILTKIADKAFSNNAEQTINDSINWLKIKKLEGRGAELVTKMRIAKSNGADIDALLSEKVEIDASIGKLKKA